jgi:hypothetical protein
LEQAIPPFGISVTDSQLPPHLFTYQKPRSRREADKLSSVRFPGPESMALDGGVRCTCIRDGKAKPHPFPDRLTFDESGEPLLTGDPSDDEWEAHD